jgi:hypothetical protein
VTEQQPQDAPQDLAELDMGQFAAWLQSAAAKEQVLYVSLGGRHFDVSWNNFRPREDKNA